MDEPNQYGSEREVSELYSVLLLVELLFEAVNDLLGFEILPLTTES